MTDAAHRNRSLALLTVLHGFTHLYHVALLPLFLRIKSHYDLPTTDEATLLLTVLMLAYYAPSYIAGELSDRFNRKLLLTIGLALNGLGFVLLALAPSYSTAMAAVVRRPAPAPPAWPCRRGGPWGGRRGRCYLGWTWKY